MRVSSSSFCLSGRNGSVPCNMTFVGKERSDDGSDEAAVAVVAAAVGSAVERGDGAGGGCELICVVLPPRSPVSERSHESSGIGESVCAEGEIRCCATMSAPDTSETQFGLSAVHVCLCARVRRV